MNQLTPLTTHAKRLLGLCVFLQACSSTLDFDSLSHNADQSSDGGMPITDSSVEVKADAGAELDAGLMPPLELGFTDDFEGASLAPWEVKKSEPEAASAISLTSAGRAPSPGQAFLATMSAGQAGGPADAWVAAQRTLSLPPPPFELDVQFDLRIDEAPPDERECSVFQLAFWQTDSQHDQLSMGFTTTTQNRLRPQLVEYHAPRGDGVNLDGADPSALALGQWSRVHLRFRVDDARMVFISLAFDDEDIFVDVQSQQPIPQGNPEIAIGLPWVHTVGGTQPWKVLIDNMAIRAVATSRLLSHTRE